MKKIFRFIILSCVLLCLVFSLNACKEKKKKRVLREINPISTGTEIVKFGVQPQRGSDPNAPEIITGSVYIPLGLDENGNRKYHSVLAEFEEMKPEYVDAALKYYGVISEESLFGELKIVDSDETLNAGPGATDNQVLNKKGIVRYLDLGTELDNSDEYKDITDIKKMKGKIDYNDIMHCILTTFKDNFQLVDCEFDPISQEEYNKIHTNKS